MFYPQIGRSPGEAEHTLPAILELDPIHPRARNDLAVLRRRRGRGSSKDGFDSRD